MNIDISANIPGSKYFTWKEALFLPQWKICVLPNPLQYDSIIKTAQKMDAIRKIIDSPILVHCWLRPDSYNRLIGGAMASAHLFGQAVDFSCKTITAGSIRRRLVDHLETLNIRMERMPDSYPWVHVDIREPGPENNRYFYARGAW